MKYPFWTNPNKQITILDATEEAKDNYGHLYGSDCIVLEPEHMRALRSGKMLAWNDSEYTTFVVYAAEQP